MNKLKRSQFVTYLNTGTTEESWSLLGIGITDYGISYNPQTTTEKWIIHDNATTTVDSNQKQGDISQKCYKGDLVFEYINKLRDKVGDKLNCQILDIDRWDEQEEGVYSAKKSDIVIAITKYMAEDAVIEYSIYYNGDPIEGKVSFTSGKPTFTPIAE